MSAGNAAWVINKIEEHAEASLSLYQDLATPDNDWPQECADLNYPGLAAEIARSVMPLGAYTEFYWTTDAHNLMHWLRLRLDGHAQKEFRAYAEVAYQIFKAWLPALAQAFDDHVLNALTFSAKELRAMATIGLNASLVKSGDFGMSAGEVAEFAAKLARLSNARM